MTLSLRKKLLITGVALSALPIAILIGVMTWQLRAMTRTASEGCTDLAYADLDHIATNLVTMVATQQESAERQLALCLSAARDKMEQHGRLTLAKETRTWHAVNQYNQEAKDIALPVMMLGTEPIVPNENTGVETPLVDDVKKLMGSVCTIFQRVNDRGDMLRIATNVVSNDKRAIGTYIPAVEPGGANNAIVASLLSGKTYAGRANVLGTWYLATYEPIMIDGKVVGALSLATPQESTDTLRHAIMDCQVGKTGYAFVLNTKGADKGRYVISKNGERDGESIIEAVDDNGTAFIKEMCERAETLKPGEIAEVRYFWRNAEDPVAREKVSRYIYFAKWDWLIGVGSYVEEFYEARDQAVAIGNTGKRIALIASGVLLLGTFFIWLVVSSRITTRVVSVAEGLHDASAQINAGAAELSTSAQSLAEGSSEQAAAIEETSSALEQLTAVTHQNAENADTAFRHMERSKEAVDSGQDAMTRLSEVIGQIQEAANRSAAIVRTIDEIAFQTNLLALNAAVEAARAGDAGKGFAVVAEEVRNLAQRAAAAAKETAVLIEESVAKSNRGVEVSHETSSSLTKITELTQQVRLRLTEIRNSTREQTSGIDQISTAVNQMHTVTQSTAANSEETAAASEELASQSELLNLMVIDLTELIHGVRDYRSEEEQNDTDPGHFIPAEEARKASHQQSRTVKI